MLDIIILVFCTTKVSGFFKAAGKKGAGKYIGGIIACYLGGAILMMAGLAVVSEVDSDALWLMLFPFLFYILGIIGAVIVYRQGKKAAGPPLTTYYSPYSAPVQPVGSNPHIHYGQSCGACGATSDQLAAVNDGQWDGLGFCAQCNRYYCVNCQQTVGFGQCPVCSGALTEKASSPLA